MTNGIILYGPPAAGKDTVTHELATINPRYTHFNRLKVGPGRTAGYRSADMSMLADLHAHGDLLYTNERYGATYAIDRPGLDEIVAADDVPVVHLGQVDGILAVVGQYPLNWVVAGLWCSRSEAAQRLTDRGDAQVAARLFAWDETLADFQAADPGRFTLVLNTAIIAADESARIIDSCCQ